MGKEEEILNFYKLCSQLKYVIITGFNDWDIQKDRLESAAERICNTQMLALAIKSKYKYDIDITKVIYMLLIREIGDIIVKDNMNSLLGKEEKPILNHEEVREILSSLLNKKDIEKIYIEFHRKQTKEAKFAYYCYELQCEIESKLYGSDNYYYDLDTQENNNTFGNNYTQDLCEDIPLLPGIELEDNQGAHIDTNPFRTLSKRINGIK